MDVLFNIKRIKMVFLCLSFFVLKFSKSHFCPENICKLCCKPTQSGCVNGFVQNYNQALTSVSLACQDVVGPVEGSKEWNVTLAVL
uniref:Uncharacterized protein n=1 Tax=Theileria parva TaxID=5875 RepID=Q4N485_THEPA|eukprot:XP_765321.1 hypothetical protein [Theileria parva strain Muguga]